MSHHADYFAYGVSVSEVEIDCLTGDIVILRSDILYDSGASINTIIDIGQAEGAFVMGIGYFTREEVLISPDGKLNTDSTWEYKIPCSLDIPQHFKVELLKNSTFPGGVMLAKGIGEPPMVLAYSVVGAIKRAITASRKERGLPYPILNAPISIDSVQVACGLSKNDFVFYVKES